jgi:uracil-DNA glycosylase
MDSEQTDRGQGVEPATSVVRPADPAAGGSPVAEGNLATLQERIAACRRCVDAGYLVEAHPVHRGKGTPRARLMIVGQAPGATGHLHPQPFSGAAGRTLAGWLTEAGFPPGALHDGDRCFLTSVTKCFPGPSGGGKGDRMPSAAEVGRCRDYLDRELALVRPAVVLALGRLAATELLGPAPLVELVGQTRPLERAGGACTVVTLSHPSGISRWLNQPANRARHVAALALLSDLRARLGL